MYGRIFSILKFKNVKMKISSRINFYYFSTQSAIFLWSACLIIACCTIEQIFVSTNIDHHKIAILYSPPDTGVASAAFDSEVTLMRQRWNHLPPRIPRNYTQQCANARLDRSRHRLILENKGCPVSFELNNDLPKTKIKELREPGLTFLLIYYNDDLNLSHQLDSWMKFSTKALSRIRFIVVDDGSDVGHRAVELLGSNFANITSDATIVEESYIDVTPNSIRNDNKSKNNLSSLDIRVYEIDQDIDWNIGGARNLGFWIASQDSDTDVVAAAATAAATTFPSPWVFMNDADILVPPETMDFVLGLTEESSGEVDNDNYGLELNTTKKQHYSPYQRNSTNNNNKVYGFFQRIGKRGNFKKKNPHPAVMLSTTDSYWTAGGCDEDFVGNYGYTDPHFFYRVGKHHSLRVVNIHEKMDLLSISPLIEMSKKHKFRSKPKRSFPSIINNNDNNDGEKKAKLTLSKNTAINKELYVQKISSGNWSIDYLRFTWRRVW